MNLFFNQNISETDHQIVFDKEESRHISKVLRKKLGDTLYTTNGQGVIFTSEISSVTPKRSIANIIDITKAPTPSYKLHMAVAPTKNNDRFEWFLEKATEIGVSSVYPIICDHSERKIIKLERFHKIVQSAMKQSLKSYLPVIHPLQTFKGVLATFEDASISKVIAHCEDVPKKHLIHSIAPKEDILILIGPEGDFSLTEIELASNQGFKEVGLGDSRLRTETAAIAACHTISLINEE